MAAGISYPTLFDPAAESFLGTPAWVRVKYDCSSIDKVLSLAWMGPMRGGPYTTGRTCWLGRGVHRSFLRSRDSLAII